MENRNVFWRGFSRGHMTSNRYNPALPLATHNIVQQTCQTESSPAPTSSATKRQQPSYTPTKCTLKIPPACWPTNMRSSS